MSCALLSKIGASWLTHKYISWDFYFTKICKPLQVDWT